MQERCPTSSRLNSSSVTCSPWPWLPLQCTSWSNAVFSKIAKLSSSGQLCMFVLGLDVTLEWPSFAMQCIALAQDLPQRNSTGNFEMQSRSWPAMAHIYGRSKFSFNRTSTSDALSGKLVACRRAVRAEILDNKPRRWEIFRGVKVAVYRSRAISRILKISRFQ